MEKKFLFEKSVSTERVHIFLNIQYKCIFKILCKISSVFTQTNYSYSDKLFCLKVY